MTDWSILIFFYKKWCAITGLLSYMYATPLQKVRSTATNAEQKRLYKRKPHTNSWKNNDRRRIAFSWPNTGAYSDANFRDSVSFWQVRCIISNFYVPRLHYIATCWWTWKFIIMILYAVTAGYIAMNCPEFNAHQRILYFLYVGILWLNR